MTEPTTGPPSNFRMAPNMEVPLASIVSINRTTRSDEKDVAQIKTIERREYTPKSPRTINELIQQRAGDDRSDAPIVAYPSKLGQYQYYTPKQVCSLCIYQLSMYQAANKLSSLTHLRNRQRFIMLRSFLHEQQARTRSRSLGYLAYQTWNT